MLKNVVISAVFIALIGALGYWRGASDATAAMRDATETTETRLKKEAQTYLETNEHLKMRLEEVMKDAEGNVVIRPCLDASRVRSLNTLR